VTGKRQAANEITRARRQQRVLELRETAMSVRAIATQIIAEGLAPADYNHATVSRDVKSEFKRLQERGCEIAEHARAMELLRLDVMLHAVWGKIGAGDVRAIDTALRVGERRAKLLGLDAPVKQDMTSNGNSLVIEYVNDWRNTSAIPAPWSDGGAAAGAAAQHFECRPTLEEIDTGDGDSG